MRLFNHKTQFHYSACVKGKGTRMRTMTPETVIEVLHARVIQLLLAKFVRILEQMIGDLFSNSPKRSPHFSPAYEGTKNIFYFLING